MRLWSLHPGYLDAKGLVALWREGLLAQKVLNGGTRGYRHHPQLQRFRRHQAPSAMIAAYLTAVWDESIRRNYRFDRSRIPEYESASLRIEVTEGQLRYELAHLLGKLELRDPQRAESLGRVDLPDPHPCLVVVPGPIEPWERS